MSQNHRFYFNDHAETWHNKTSPHLLVETLLKFGIRQEDVVLDVGAGTGALTLPLLQLAPLGKIVAVDFSDKMLLAARHNIGAANALYSCTDACALAFRHNSVDKIVCYSTFPHFRNPLAALGEFYRVLKPFGRILIFHNCCSRKLNQYHAHLPGLISFDKLPKSEQLSIMLQHVGFQALKTKEGPELYWVEGEKKVKGSV